MLIDSRHGVKEVDREIMKLLDESAVNYQIVLTKADKLKPKELTSLRRKVGEQVKDFIAVHPDLLLTSSEKGWGIDEVRAVMADLASW